MQWKPVFRDLTKNSQVIHVSGVCHCANFGRLHPILTRKLSPSNCHLGEDVHAADLGNQPPFPGFALRPGTYRGLAPRFLPCASPPSVWVPCAVAFGASLLRSTGKASTPCSGRVFCRCPLTSRAAYLPSPLSPCGVPFGPSIIVPSSAYLFLRLSALEWLNSFARLHDLPGPLLTLRQGQDESLRPSHDSVTCRRSPEVSSTAFDAQPPDLPPVRLMDKGFVVICRLARHRRPPIRFLSIGSHLCSSLLSGPPRGGCDFTLTLRYNFTSISLSKGLSPSSCRTCSAHKEKPPA
jgi:hypothetical protein